MLSRLDHSLMLSCKRIRERSSCGKQKQQPMQLAEDSATHLCHTTIMKALQGMTEAKGQQDRHSAAQQHQKGKTPTQITKLCHVIGLDCHKSKSLAAACVVWSQSHQSIPSCMLFSCPVHSETSQGQGLEWRWVWPRILRGLC